MNQQHPGQKKPTIWDVLSPKKAYVSGLVSGLLVAGLIALVVSLIVVVSDGEKAETKTVKADTDTPSVATGDTFDVETFRNPTGAEDPELYLVEFSDFECSYCGRHHSTMLSIMDTYADQVAWVWKHFPLSFHPEALPAAKASECAGEQGKFWEFGDALMADQENLGEDLYKQVAEDVGLDIGDWEKCLEDEDIAARIAADQKDGSAVGVQGTPATLIVDKDGNILQTISGAVPETQLTSAIDANL